jgi:hypothetical protein
MLIKHLKTYSFWFIVLLSSGFAAKLIYAPIASLIFLGVLIVPGDRIRVKMIKSGLSYPDAELGWQLVFLCSIIPFVFGVHSSLFAELDEGMHRANLVVGGIVFWGIFTFGLNALLFRSNRYWENTAKRFKSIKEVD